MEDFVKVVEDHEVLHRYWSTSETLSRDVNAFVTELALSSGVNKNHLATDIEAFLREKIEGLLERSGLSVQVPQLLPSSADAVTPQVRPEGG